MLSALRLAGSGAVRAAVVRPPWATAPQEARLRLRRALTLLARRGASRPPPRHGNSHNNEFGETLRRPKQQQQQQQQQQSKGGPSPGPEPSGPPPNGPPPLSMGEIVAAAALFGIVAFLTSSEGGGGGGGFQTVTWQEFYRKMLATGEVARLVVDADGEHVHVFLHDGAIIPGYNDHTNNLVTRLPNFRLSIASVKAFERRMKVRERRGGREERGGGDMLASALLL